MVYEGPVRAPIRRGDRLGELVLEPDSLPEMRVPLVATENVAAGGFMPRLKTVSILLLNRLQQGPEGAL